jgi:FkbM family methyltransferase
VVPVALVPAVPADGLAVMHYAGLMSTAEGAWADPGQREEHIRRGLTAQNLAETYQVRVPARTLTAVLDEAAPGREIDLLSLDVEGMEADVLRGLDFARYAPRFICVEARNRPAIEAVLSGHYRLVAMLADQGVRQDLLYGRSVPG